MKTFIAVVTASVIVGALAPFAYAGVPTRDLSFGMRGDDVVSLQQELITLDGPAAKALAGVGATGYFGPLTRAALVEFQKSEGVTPAQGYYGAKTRAALTLRAEPEVLYTGTISAVDTGCFVDAVCSVTVGGKKVVLLTGERLGETPRPLGSIKGADSIGDLEAMIGKEARVYAAKLNEEWGDYTLYGKADYYVQVLGKLPANGEVTLTGTTVCLPAKDPNGGVIKLCAMGLLADDGRYYALSGEAATGGEGEVEVTGDFTKGESVHPVFLSEGTIEVERMREVK